MTSLFRPTKLIDSIKNNLFKTFGKREQFAFQGLSVEILIIKPFIIGAKKEYNANTSFSSKSDLEAGSFVSTITENLDISFQGLPATLILLLPKFTEKNTIRDGGSTVL